ncbi:HNH endonuclease [Tessaracoccus caeni]|uniref:HNH endonuclease n=1 Tax=Tessaracoccus caeni TaxID=3031239 RepID=UPI0023DA2122|nr:HNH endonuclease [Tessaracoccus caeni]MDF1488731.1 HNH endonuclease [Tessaracoccus caeni]
MKTMLHTRRAFPTHGIQPSRTNTVFVIGLDYDVKGEVHWTSAVSGILDGIYSPFKVEPTRRVRSAGGTVDMAWPIIVRLNYWVTIPHRKAPDLHTRCSRLDVLRRDGWTCAYCGDYANTVDHVLPDSRGGGWTWGNLVAACGGCNEFKAARTPEEAGMKLLWDPRVDVTQYAGVQAEVWRSLQHRQ